MEQFIKRIIGYDPPPLSATEKGSFAYITVKDRLPIILTKVIDLLCREKDVILKDYGENATEEIKDIVGQLSQMKNELQTNKSMRILETRPDTLDDKYDDTLSWNLFLQSYKEKYQIEPKWFEVTWLFAETYFYKRIHDSFLSSKLLKAYDPFSIQKTSALENASEIINLLSERITKEVLQSTSPSLDEKKNIVFELIEVSLWGNQWDLSISCGSEIERENSISNLAEMRDNILVSELENFWHHLIRLPTEQRRIAFVLDNVGPELFADFCLATALIKFGFVDSVSFYTKTRPWYISDTTIVDFNWTLDYLRKKDGIVKDLIKVFEDYLKSEVWDIKERSFWTTHYAFSEMKKVDANLYKELESYSFIIFKGDLNYRKLVRDLNWPNKTRMGKALGGFLPSSLLILRTIKGGPTVGLDESSQTVRKAKLKENWDISGEMGLIQFIPYGSNSCIKNCSLLFISGVVLFLVAFYTKSLIN